jgi:predicted RNase H-like nuclease (RuvC/YqgF family)
MTDPIPLKPRRGRKPTGTAMTNAERQRAYRQRQQTRLAQDVTPAGSGADLKAENAELRRKLAAAEAEIRGLNQEGDRLTLENDRLHRSLEARDNEVARLTRALDEKHHSLERLRTNIGRWKRANQTGIDGHGVKLKTRSLAR